MQPRLKLLSLLLVLVVNSSCWSSDEVIFELMLGGAVDEIPSGADVWIEAYYESIGSEELATDIFLIDTFVLPGGGSFTYDLLYPVDGGAGLFLYAWADLDGDGALCAPGVTNEPVGGVRFGTPTEEPLDSILLSLSSPCISPERLAADLTR